MAALKMVFGTDASRHTSRVQRETEKAITDLPEENPLDRALKSVERLEKATLHISEPANSIEEAVEQMFGRRE